MRQQKSTLFRGEIDEMQDKHILHTLLNSHPDLRACRFGPIIEQNYVG